MLVNPEAGASAILELARQTERLHSLSDSASGTTFNVGVMSGGTRSNVVAAEAKIEVDVRFSRMKEAQQISELMRNLEPFDKRIRLTVAGGLNRGPLERTEGVVRLYQHAREVAGCLGFELRERSVGGPRTAISWQHLVFQSSMVLARMGMARTPHMNTSWSRISCGAALCLRDS